MSFTPSVIVSFDDGYPTDYDAYQYMSSRGIKGTSFLITSLVDTAGIITTTELDEMYAGGWDMAMHTDTHVNLSLATPAVITTEINACRDWLNNAGFSRASDLLAYPWGAYEGSLDTLESLGVTAARTTSVKGFPTVYGPDNKLLFPGGIILEPSMTLQAAKDRIDELILNGESMFILGHGLVESNPTGVQWTFSAFYALMDHVKIKMDNLLLQSKTFSSYIDGLS